MSQNKEASEFISRVISLPKGPVSLDGVLQPSLDDEAELRKLFATDKGNKRLKDTHVGLVDVFAAPPDIKIARARVIASDADRDAQHVMPLLDSQRRKEGSPAMVEDLEVFRKNWTVFTENSLSQLSNWSNVIVAGGSVQACLVPLPKAATASKKAMRKYYHNKAFPSSDVDLFLYGLTTQEAERKIIAIYEAVRDSVPWDVTCVRTKHAISIHSQYPYRSVQIVLRLYSSPAEVLAGFDVDAPCCAYDGDRVWASPRAIIAMMRQSNTVDMTRRSPSYEVRLAKYASRGFEIYIPELRRSGIDPTIYERAVGRVQGLARLLAIEKLATPESRDQYQQQRRVLRGRPTEDNRFTAYGQLGRRYNGDLKADPVFSGLELSDYDIVTLHIPYGPGWDARRIEKLIYKTDFGANSPYNPKNKNRSLHRHSAFFGTIEECMEDCCEYCPQPRNAEEHDLQDEEDKSYVRGRIAFIQEDPGRQSISGSFNPIDEGEWSESAYIQATAKFFGAVSQNDIAAVTQMIEAGEDLNRRDHVGRTPLHVAILSNSVEVAESLIDAGARMTARLVGGRTSFHLAAQMGQATLVKKMLTRSTYNEKLAEEKRNMEEAGTVEDPEVAERVRLSSEDDWSSEESDDSVTPAKTPRKTDPEKDDVDSLEEDDEAPDVLDIAISDWDFGFTALGYAILSGSQEVVDVLLTAGADPNFAARAKGTSPFHPLTLTIHTQDEERAVQIAERLMAARGVSSTADENLLTIFHRLVIARKTKIITSLLTSDPNAKKVLNIPAWSGHASGLVFPVVSSILSGDYATMAVLLAHGAKLAYSPEDASKAHRGNAYRARSGRIYLPVEVALVQRDEVISLLVALGATVDMVISASYQQSMTLLQWTSSIVSGLWTTTPPGPMQEPPTSPAGDSWSEYRSFIAAILPIREDMRFVDAILPIGEDERFGDVIAVMGPYERPVCAILPIREDERFVALPGPKVPWNALAPQLNEENGLATRDFYARAESILRSHSVGSPEAPQHSAPRTVATSGAAKTGYICHLMFGMKFLPTHLKVLYDELYEACWVGDNATIQELCLPKNIQEGQEPIQISVQTAALDGFTQFTGWSPFLVALHRRHWETARLVIAIATAQYQPPDAEPTPIDLIPTALSDSDDEGSDHSSEEDYSTQEEINFTDLAARPSAVRAQVSAKMMLEAQSGQLVADKRVICNPLQKTVYEDDFEAFVRTLELYEFAGVALWPCAGDLVVKLDRPDMLDELTRRTGVGIPIPSEAAKKTNTSSKNAIEERVYLGLKVGGKRRAEIMQQGQRELNTLSHNYDLLREAIAFGATKVIEYLAGSRPLAAYTYYAATHSDDIAQYLKSIDDLSATLPGLLGWRIDELNESPLLCAVIHNKPDILKLLFALKPNLMEEALHRRSKFVGFNALLAAAYYCSGTEIVDFLLEKDCDPSERDARGWNIYHLACLSENKKRVKFVAHLLKTLPEELTHGLMAQASREASNTPLMLAVKRGHIVTLRTVLEFGVNPALCLLKDADGSTPLHIAAQNSNSALVQVLLQHGPAEHAFTENSVGQTPLEISGLKGFPRVMGATEAPRPTEPYVEVTHSLRNIRNTAPFDLEKQKVEIPKLRVTLDALLADGRLVRGTKLATELLSFAARLEGKLAIEVAKKNAARKDDEEDDVDPIAQISDPTRTYALLQDAAASHPKCRRLVHLTDVQRSVQRSLEQQAQRSFVSSNQQRQASDEESKEADPEEERITQLKARSLFKSASGNYRSFGYDPKNEVNLFGNDQF